jgi:hypothetical protein
MRWPASLNKIGLSLNRFLWNPAVHFAQPGDEGERLGRHMTLRQLNHMPMVREQQHVVLASKIRQ